MYAVAQKELSIILLFSFGIGLPYSGKASKIDILRNQGKPGKLRKLMQYFLILRENPENIFQSTFAHICLF